MPLIFSKDNGILSYSLPIWQFYTDRNLALLFGTLFAIYSVSYTHLTLPTTSRV